MKTNDELKAMIGDRGFRDVADFFEAIIDRLPEPAPAPEPDFDDVSIELQECFESSELTGSGAEQILTILRRIYQQGIEAGKASR